MLWSHYNIRHTISVELLRRSLSSILKDDEQQKTKQQYDTWIYVRSFRCSTLALVGKETHTIIVVHAYEKRIDDDG